MNSKTQLTPSGELSLITVLYTIIPLNLHPNLEQDDYSDIKLFLNLTRKKFPQISITDEDFLTIYIRNIMVSHQDFLNMLKLIVEYINNLQVKNKIEIGIFTDEEDTTWNNIRITISLDVQSERLFEIWEEIYHLDKFLDEDEIFVEILPWLDK